MADNAFLILVEPDLQLLDWFLRHLSLVFEDINEANVTYEDEVVRIVEKALYCVQPILFIEKTEEYIGYVFSDLPSRVRMSRIWTEASQ